MNKTEQINFVHDLTRTVAQQVIDDINDGRVPSRWNGIELRWLLADRFGAQTRGDPDREYKNTVRVNAL